MSELLRAWSVKHKKKIPMVSFCLVQMESHKGKLRYRLAGVADSDHDQVKLSRFISSDDLERVRQQPEYQGTDRVQMGPPQRRRKRKKRGRKLSEPAE